MVHLPVRQGLVCFRSLPTVALTTHWESSGTKQGDTLPDETIVLLTETFQTCAAAGDDIVGVMGFRRVLELPLVFSHGEDTNTFRHSDSESCSTDLVPQCYQVYS